MTRSRGKKAKAKKSVGKQAAPRTGAERLAVAIADTESALEQAAGRLAEARKRVDRAARVAREKRTQAAHAVAERAREAVATINARRLDVTLRLNAARNAIQAPLDDPDWRGLEHALREALARFVEALGDYDRRVEARARDRRES